MHEPDRLLTASLLAPLRSNLARPKGGPVALDVDGLLPPALLLLLNRKGYR